MADLKHGGKRPGSGRKPLPITQKKTVLTLYPSNADLYKFGDKVKMQEEILKFIAGYGKQEAVIHNLNEPTHQIKTPEQPKTNYQVTVEPPGIGAVLGSFEGFKQKILGSKVPAELVAIMKEVKVALLSNRDKLTLETIAKEHSKTMYND